MSSALATVRTLKEEDQDFEWYPTTDEILATIKVRLDEDFYHNNPSILDIGAGDGRSLKALTDGSRYAVEKAKPLLELLPKDIFVVGTEFHELTLIDKKVDVIFCNPPYSEFEHWAAKIIKEANCKTIYLVIPTRWSKSLAIEQALKTREAEAKILSTFDFLSGDRAARAVVDVIEVSMTYVGHSNSNPKVDAFKVWFDDYFKVAIEKDSDDPKAEKETLTAKVKSEMVDSKSGVIDVLHQFYTRDMDMLMNNYRSFETIDGDLLKELGVGRDGIMKSLQFKITGLKDLYWKELFNSLDKITARLTVRNRKTMLELLTSHTHVDFTPSNAYAVAVWVIKNANDYFDEQTTTIVERMVAAANIHNYKSNKRTFGENDWRYNGSPTAEQSHYSLDLRCVLSRVGGINGSEYRFNQRNGLANSAFDFLSDLRTVANNLGFRTDNAPTIDSMGEWHSGKSQTIKYMADGKEGSLCEVKAFKNGNMHIKFNQKFIMRLNVEHGRLKGWIKSPQEAADEMSIPLTEAQASFKANLRLGSALLKALTYKA